MAPHASEAALLIGSHTEDWNQSTTGETAEVIASPKETQSPTIKLMAVIAPSRTGVHILLSNHPTKLLSVSEMLPNALTA